MIKLPIDILVPDVLAALRAERNAVLVAEPGAGKSTRLPPAIARELLTPGKCVLLLQPRRVAARSIASRIAQEQAWRLGEEVGYQVRFENRTRPNTMLRVITEGILTRRIQSDPFLEDVVCVILDEFHERSIHTDLALALLREIQATVRPDLHILVMSATMDPAPVSAFLHNAPILRSEGRKFPLHLEYLPRPSSAPAWEKAAEAAQRAMQNPGGHILVFLPGIGEIRRTHQLLDGAPAEIRILHSSVSAEDQDRALAPSTRRKLILATNIAETSITIDGVTMVIDTGLARVPLRDSRLGIDRLELRRISRASADQRAGRAARTAPGTCYRLWTQAENSGLEPSDIPEILRVDLAPAVLALKIYGARDLSSFQWFDAPRAQDIAQAERLLHMIGALDSRGGVTEIGQRIANIPTHPRLARLLDYATQNGYARDGALIAAMLAERDFLTTSSGAPTSHGPSDILHRLDLLQQRRGQQNDAAVQTLFRARDQLLNSVSSQSEPAGHRDDVLLKSLLVAYPDRVTVRRATDATRGAMVGNRGIVLEISSIVREAPLFLSLDPRDPDPGKQSRTSESVVTLASAIHGEWLDELLPGEVCREHALRYDPARDKVLAVEQLRYADLIIDEKITGRIPHDLDPGASLLQHLQQLPGGAVRYISDQPEAAALLARLQFAQQHAPDLDLPPLDEEFLAAALSQAFSGKTSLASVAAANVLHALENQIDYRLRRHVDELAPTTLPVPSGSRIKLQYPDFQLPAPEPLPPPILAVRLQELFGLHETPRIAGGRVPVLIHLLGPNYRPVQVTADLANFWRTIYAEVRKELRGRYPRHPWPEDPTQAPAVAVGRRKRPA